MNMLRGDIKKVICLLFSNLDFYFEKNGFKRKRKFKTAEGREMYEYRFNLGEKE